MIRFLLIAPRPEDGANFAGFAGDGGAMARVAAVGIATVAALAPPGVQPILLDESIQPVDFDAHVDVVGISANVSQVRRALAIAAEFQARGRTVVIGGPHVTLDPEAFAGAGDVTVSGEFEEIAAEFFADMLAGRLKPHYRGGRPDLSTSPPPAWPLYENDRAMMGVVQTSRGCPFECNFCDVIQYLGRVQRHKSDAQVLAEVQQLYDLGYDRIMLADDNFTVYRRRTASLLQALADWNGTDGRGFVTFATQTSIDVARSPDLLAACAQAGLLTLFIGIETDNEESLKESKKRQNLGQDVVGQVRDVVTYGLRVEAGLIVGFDADGLDIFERQYDFAMRLPVGTFKISALNAPRATPLYADMAARGRIDAGNDLHFTAADINTNIVPAQMSQQELAIGARWLINRLFRPAAFVERFETLAGLIGVNPLLARAQPYDPPARRGADRMFGRMVRTMARRDAEVLRAISRCNEIMRARPEVRDGLGDVLTTWLLELNNYMQRGLYDPAWSELATPPIERRRRRA